MTLEGIVVNGVIVLDGTPRLPEGARVRVELTPDDPDAWEHAPPPPSGETREELLASLRESIAEAKAGVPGRTVDEVFAEVDAELRRIVTERGN
jgi:hypothetical protein